MEHTMQAVLILTVCLLVIASNKGASGRSIDDRNDQLQGRKVTSSDDPNSPLWMKCKKVHPGPNDRQITHRIYSDCTVTEVIPGDPDDYPTVEIVVSADKFNYEPTGNGKEPEPVLAKPTTKENDFKVGLVKANFDQKYRIERNEANKDVEVELKLAEFKVQAAGISAAGRIAGGFEFANDPSETKVFVRGNIDVEIDLGDVKIGAGLGLDTGVAIAPGAIEVKALGTGFALNKEKIEVCLGPCVTVNYQQVANKVQNFFGSIFGRRKRSIEYQSALDMVQEMHAELMLRSSQGNKTTAVALLAKVVKVMNQTRIEIGMAGGNLQLKNLCKSQDKTKRKVCSEAKSEYKKMDVFKDEKLKTGKNQTKLVAKKGQFARIKAANGTDLGPVPRDT